MARGQTEAAVIRQGSGADVAQVAQDDPLTGTEKCTANEARVEHVPSCACDSNAAKAPITRQACGLATIGLFYVNLAHATSALETCVVPASAFLAPGLQYMSAIRVNTDTSFIRPALD